VREARFASAFTFQYSPRPGTPAAQMDAQVPAEVVAERYARLVELQEQVSWDENLAVVGRQVEVLVASGEGRKDAGTGRISGRARDGRLVHLRADARPGDVVTTTVTAAAPHHLLADGADALVRRTRAGDRGAERAPASAGSPAPVDPTGVGLGMPQLRPASGARS